MEEEEKIQLNCPICKNTHEFRLEVDKSHVLYHMTSMPSERERTVKRFRRLFTCPEKNEPFEATIRMEESFSEIIHNVKVV